MTTTRKWVGTHYTGTHYRTKGEARKNSYLGEVPVRVKFRFETVWILMGVDGEVTTVTTPDGRMLIGYNDPYMQSHGDVDIEAFCWALIDRQRKG